MSHASDAQHGKGRRRRPAGDRAEDAGAPRPAAAYHKPAVGPAMEHTNQDERAAMHPDGDDLEWHYYHGGWSG